jgi:surface polysaccharide O-acyltransferase-like enzyme
MEKLMYQLTPKQWFLIGYAIIMLFSSLLAVEIDERKNKKVEEKYKNIFDFE